MSLVKSLKFAVGGVLMLAAGAVGPFVAQQASAQADMLAYDGQSYMSQSAGTQQLFSGTYGAEAASRWVSEHNAQLVAAGYVPPMGQSGAQVNSSPSDDNDNSDDKSDNSDDQSDNSDDKNDNSDGKGSKNDNS